MSFPSRLAAYVVGGKRLIWLLLVGSLLAFSFWHLKLRFTVPSPQPPMQVRVVAVAERQLGEAMRLLGEFVPLEGQKITSRVAAPVKELHAEIGDKAQKGQTLAVLDDSQIKANRQEAEARLALAEQNLDRIEALRSSPAYSTALREDRLQERDVAAAALRNADAALRWTIIKAPYRGTVTRRYADVGEWLSPGRAIFAFVNEENLEVEVKVPLAYFARLKRSADYDLFSGDAHLGIAELRAVVPQASASSRTRIARLVPQFTSDGIAANQAVIVELPATEGRRLVVPKDAIINEAGKSHVFVVEEGENGFIADIRSLELGSPEGSDFAVVSGLSPGELVVVRGNERIIPGQVVRISKN